MERLKECFGAVWGRKGPHEVNEVCCCITRSPADGGDVFSEIDHQPLSTEEATSLKECGVQWLKQMQGDKKYTDVVKNIDFASMKLL